MNKIFGLLIVGLLVVSSIGLYSINQNELPSVPIETDYRALVDLGQAPNSEAREPDEGDIDTGVTGNYEGVPIRLYSSRTWANDDYGKTFLWRDD